MRRSSFVVLVVAFVVILGGGTAMAAPPSNDTFAGRKAITLGFTESLDTTEATTDADDADPGCVPPATDASVWYDYTAASSDTVEADLTGTFYTAGVIVVTGSPGNFTHVACDPGGVIWDAEAGTTYHILVFDDQSDFDGVNGGQLEFAFHLGPNFDLVLDRAGVFTKAGTAIIGGTLTCSNAPFETELFVFVRQTVGRVFIQGQDSIFDLDCDGAAHRVSVEVTGDNGKFKGGSVEVKATPSGCDNFGCAGKEFIVTMRLKGK